MIGQAFVGPTVLNLRSDISLASPTVATVHYGDRVDILRRRRVFLRVRTARGAEGWTESRQLLAPADMAALSSLAVRAASMPVQGQAISYDDLNVHVQPSREAPSFLLIKAKEKFDVLASVAVPAIPLPRAPLITPAPKKATTAPKKSATSKYPPPPMPQPPGPPPNWLEMSRSDAGDAPAAGTHDAPPVPISDWSLIRTSGGPVGWVLTRRISMAIPDEVAQYAEGHRIVSYFSLGAVHDGDARKDIWLWTTVADGIHPYDFDSFRVFVWSLRRHRYETAHIERNLEGHLPVLLENVSLAEGKGKAASRGISANTRCPGFSICVEKDGSLYRRQYALLGNTVRSAGQEPCELPPPIFSMTAPAPPPQAGDAGAAPAGQPSGSFWEKIRRMLKRAPRDTPAPPRRGPER